MPQAIAGLMETKDNNGQLVAPKPTEAPTRALVPEIEPTRAFALHKNAVEYFELYKRSKPRGYFGASDVPTLEKLCIALVLYDKAMNEYMDRPLVDIDKSMGEELAVEKVDVHFGIMIKLTDTISRLVKLLGLTPLDRGRPVMDDYGRAVIQGTRADTPEEDALKGLQMKFLGKSN